MVWLTTDPDCAHDHGLAETEDGTDKARVRVTVELVNRDVHKWREWAMRRGIADSWLRALVMPGASTWRVTAQMARCSGTGKLLRTHCGRSEVVRDPHNRFPQVRAVSYRTSSQPSTWR